MDRSDSVSINSLEEYPLEDEVSLTEEDMKLLREDHKSLSQDPLYKLCYYIAGNIKPCEIK